MPTLTACRLTANIPSAIATISVSGDESHLLVGSIVNRNTSDWQPSQVRLLMWPVSDELFEHVVACRTSEQIVELHCHGGQAVTHRILEQLSIAGCEIIAAVDQQKRELELSKQSDRVIEFICQQALLACSSERSAGYLLDQADGRLAKLFSKVIELIELGQLESLKELLTELSLWFEFGRHLIQPWKVVLAGPPNVGKSSLINAMCGQSIAIVHQQAGTTRDWIEAPIIVQGWPLSITDTAGIRSTADGIEREGVFRASQKISEADLVILVVDITEGWTKQHDEIDQLCCSRLPTPRRLICANKMDLVDGSLKTGLVPGLPNHLSTLPHEYCSAQRSIDSLLQRTAQLLVPHCPMPDEVIVFDPRHQLVLKEMLELLSRIPVALGDWDRIKLLANQLFQFD